MYSSRSLYCTHLVNELMGLAVTNVLNDVEFVMQRKLMVCIKLNKNNNCQLSKYE